MGARSMFSTFLSVTPGLIPAPERTQTAFILGSVEMKP